MDEDEEITCTHCGCSDWIELTDHEQLWHFAQYECECCGQMFGTPDWMNADEEGED